MNERETYLNNLKSQLDGYTQQLATIQVEFTGKTGKHVGKINKSLQDILQEATKAYGKLKSASADEWEPLKAHTTVAFSNLKTAFNERLSASAQQVKEYAGVVTDNCQEKLDHVETYVKDHPLKSILIAVGAGFLLGKIFK